MYRSYAQHRVDGGRRFELERGRIRYKGSKRACALWLNWEYFDGMGVGHSGDVQGGDGRERKSAPGGIVCRAGGVDLICSDI